MHVIIIKWWMIKLLKTISFCAISLKINQWTWLLIGWRLCCQPIRCQVWKYVLTNMGFNMEISLWPRTQEGFDLNIGIMLYVFDEWMMCVFIYLFIRFHPQITWYSSFHHRRPYNNQVTLIVQSYTNKQAVSRGKECAAVAQATIRGTLLKNDITTSQVDV